MFSSHSFSPPQFLPTFFSCAKSLLNCCSTLICLRLGPFPLTSMFITLLIRVLIILFFCLLMCSTFQGVILKLSVLAFFLLIYTKFHLQESILSSWRLWQNIVKNFCYTILHQSELLNNFPYTYFEFENMIFVLLRLIMPIKILTSYCTGLHEHPV
jgi:hypothetical protein